MNENRIRKVEGVGLMEHQQLIMTLVQLLIWGGLIALIMFGMIYKKRLPTDEEESE
jgi:hypothetical protein